MIAYVVQRNCGDYYCGCGGGHITGVYLTAEEAAATVDAQRMDEVTEILVGEHRWDTESWRDLNARHAWT